MVYAISIEMGGAYMVHPDGFQVLIAIDQLVNTLAGGMADETISSRAHRSYVAGRNKWARNIINALFYWQDDHCKEAYESELSRSQLPDSMRGNNDEE